LQNVDNNYKSPLNSISKTFAHYSIKPPRNGKNAYETFDLSDENDSDDVRPVKVQRKHDKDPIYQKNESSIESDDVQYMYEVETEDVASTSPAKDNERPFILCPVDDGYLGDDCDASDTTSIMSDSSAEGSPEEQTYSVSEHFLEKQSISSIHQVKLALSHGYRFANGKLSNGDLREMNDEMKVLCAPCAGGTLHLVTSFSVKHVDVAAKVVNLYANCDSQRLNVKRNNVIFNPEKLDAVANGEACFNPSCRKRLSDTQVNVNGHRFCDGSCSKSYKNNSDANSAKALERAHQFKATLPEKWGDLQKNVITKQQFDEWMKDALAGAAMKPTLVKYYESIKQFQEFMNGSPKYQIAPLKTEIQINETCNLIFSRAPFTQLLAANSLGCFYIYFADCLRLVTESMGFLTPRGGTYYSKKKKRVVIAKASNPILVKSNQTPVTKIELSNDGWAVTTLFEERNWANVAAVERTLQKMTLNLPIGRRLQDYCGGAKVKEQDRHMRFGVYLHYNLKGYGSLLLNE